MTRNYIFNLETLKIELHFEKSEYQNMSDTQKAKLKSAFLWSNARGAWVSRCKEPNLWNAKRIARELGFDGEERTGERLTFAEQLDRKAERAEARADRMEEYAANAQKRGEALQKPLNDMHGDIAFFTQININTSSGRAFTNYRNKLYARYDKGFDEYRKSEYFQARAAAARATADMKQLSDVAFLDRRIKECKKEIKKRFENVDLYQSHLDRIENGEILKRYDGTDMEKSYVEDVISHELEMIEAAMDKQMFYQNAFDMNGGGKFSRDNIKVGYKVKIKPWGLCEVVSVGKVNIGYKVLSAGLGTVLTGAYAEIAEIVEASEAAKEVHPFKEGETFTVPVWEGMRYVQKEFRIIKVTESTVKLQTGDEKPITRKPTKSKYTSTPQWCISITDSYNGTVYRNA